MKMRLIMKKIIVLLLLIIAAGILFNGCGKDGKDGLSYLNIDWVFAPISYWDNNAGIPDVFFKSQDYRCNPGTYDFEYTAWDYTYYFGTYTLTINMGEKGGFITDGKDGADKFFALWLYSTGPELVEGQVWIQAEFDKGIQKGMVESKVNKIEKSDFRSKMDYTIGPEVYTREVRKGNMTMFIEYQQAYPIE
jgi:hypothetical protein